MWILTPMQMELFLGWYSDNASCFREAIFQFLIVISKHYLHEGEAHEHNGFDFVSAQQRAGINTMTCCIYLLNPQCSLICTFTYI